MLTFGRRGGRSFTSHTVYPLFGARHLVAHSPRGDWAEAISSRYLVLWYASDGTLRRAIARANVLGPPLTAKDRERAERAMRHIARESGLPLRELTASAPSRMPPIESLFFDADGRLWIVLRTGYGKPARADVIDPDGSLAATVEWPEQVDLVDGFVRGRTALGIARGALGVERVVRLLVREIPS